MGQTVPDFSRAEAVAEFVQELRAISNHYQAQFGIPLGLVFVDTVSASFDIKEEADNAEAGASVQDYAIYCRPGRNAGRADPPLR